MQLFIFIAVIFIAVIIIGSISSTKNKDKDRKKSLVNYSYDAKDAVMTDAEKNFFRRLEEVVEDRYYIFPQMHLSALMINKTTGKYYKLGYQRILRRSVDYVLCDKVSMKPIYAVELDDSTHDTAKRKARDSMIEELLKNINLPLVRFRNAATMTDNEIAKKFESAAHQTS